jgi:hypothetical protein
MHDLAGARDVVDRDELDPLHMTDDRSAHDTTLPHPAELFSR